MTNYNQLADRVVALGFGRMSAVNPGYYVAPESTEWDDAEGLCTDGRLVLAMMQRLSYRELVQALDYDVVPTAKIDPVAILTACAEALEQQESK